MGKTVEDHAVIADYKNCVSFRTSSGYTGSIPLSDIDVKTRDQAHAEIRKLLILHEIFSIEVIDTRS